MCVLYFIVKHRSLPEPGLEVDATSTTGHAISVAAGTAYHGAVCGAATAVFSHRIGRRGVHEE